MRVDVQARSASERSGRAVRAGGRARILEVARAAFIERGFADVSMQEIADTARLTKAAIYYHFRDKQELLEAVVIGEMQRINHGIAEQLAVGPPLRAQLERVAAFGLGTGRGDLRRLVNDAHRYGNPDRLRALRSQAEGPFDLLRSAFIAAQSAGEIGDIDIDRILALYINMVEGQVKGAGLGVITDASPEDLARTIANLVMDGIATPAARHPQQSEARPMAGLD